MKFSQLTVFVRREARKATDPVYGKEVPNAPSEARKYSQCKQTGQSIRFSGPSKSFATNAAELPRTCYISDCKDATNKALAFTRPCIFGNGTTHSLDVCGYIMLPNY